MICPICKSDKTNHLLDPYRGGSIYVCQRCTNAFTVPIPQIDYGKGKFFQHTLVDQEEHRLYARRILDFSENYALKGRLLDVGSGGGYLLEEALKRGLQAEGIEPSLSAVKYCRRQGLKVKHGFLEEISFPSEYFDVVIASHVLEHVKDQFQFLAICKQILEHNGHLFLSQTNYTGTIPQILGKFWEGWVSKEHIIHFTPFGIKYLLAKSGFRVTAVKILPLGYSLRWNWGNFSIMANNLYNSLNYLISKIRIGFPFMGDQMYIWAKKMD